MKTAVGVFLILSLCLSPIAADDSRTFAGWDGSRFRTPDGTYRVGLALSGGGARGLAHLGVLKAFEESGINVAAIAGTSMGSIVGGLYASGYSADSLISRFRGVRFSQFFTNRPPRNSMFLTQRPEKERYLLSLRFDGFKPFIPQGLTAGQRLTDLLTELTLKADYLCGGDFKNLKFPFCAVTTDIVAGKTVILDSGDLTEAMRSAMAFPLAFTGVEKDSMILMDGGILNPIPVSAIPAGKNEIHLKVAVNTTSLLLPQDKISDPFDIANQVTSIMQMDEIVDGLKTADIVITPAIDEYLATDFDAFDSLVARGYRAGLKAAHEIRAAIDRKNRREAIYITSVKYPKIGDYDWHPLAPGAIIKDSTLADIVTGLLDKNDLFSLTLVSTSPTEGIDGYRNYDLTLEAEPGADLRQIAVAIQGNEILGDSLVYNCLTRFGPVLSGRDLQKFRDSLKAIYDSLGLDLAHVRHIAWSPSNREMKILIDEGRIHEVTVEGHDRTKDWLIKSSFSLERGQPFNLNKASRGVKNVYGTDLFDRVAMHVTPSDSGAVVKISVEEKIYTQLRLGWHWHDEYNSEQFAEILDDNLFGTGQELLLHAQYGPRRQAYELSLKADRFLSTYLTYRGNVYYHTLERHQFDAVGEVIETVDESRLGLEFILGQQIRRFGTVSGEIRWEEIDNHFDSAKTDDDIRLRSLALRSLVETIDRYPFPHEGKKHLFVIEYAADILGGETRYTRGFSSIESYFPLGSKWNLHPKLAVGWTDTDEFIPVSEKFFMGGMDSFFGYRTDELIGDKMILGNLELRYKLPYRFYLTMRYDLGEVYKSAEDIKLKNLRDAAGAILSFDSPLGPISFGYGYSDRDHDRLYFSAGLAF